MICTRRADRRKRILRFYHSEHFIMQFVSTKYKALLTFAFISAVANAIEPDGVYKCDKSEIRISDSRVVTEVNYEYDYTASIDKGNGGGFLSGHTYNTENPFTPSAQIKDYYRDSYVEFAAALTDNDVACKAPGAHLDYGCDVFQVTYLYENQLTQGLAKRVFGFDVVEGNKWRATVYDFVDGVNGWHEEIRVEVATENPGTFVADTHATYRFVAKGDSFIFESEADGVTSTILTLDKVVLGSYLYDRFNVDHTFMGLNATVGKYQENADDGIPYGGAECKEYDFKLDNQADYIMWRPNTPEEYTGGDPAMAMFLSDGAAAPAAPEPTTATLSLLALSVLAMRRRRASR